MLKTVGAAALIMSALAVGGCDRQASGQTVAVVNGEEISAAELNAELALANIPASADRKAIMPQLLQRVIDRRLMAQHATDQGTDKTPEYLTRQRRLDEELRIGLHLKRQGDGIKMPDQRAIDAFIAANPGAFHQRVMLSLDQIIFDRPADMRVLERLKSDHSLDDLGRSLAAIGIPYERRDNTLDTAKLPQSVTSQIAALPPGEPFIVPEAGKLVANVIKASKPMTARVEEYRSYAAGTIRKQQLDELVDTQLKQLKSKAKIDYQAGYEPPKAPPGATKTATIAR